MIDELDIRIMTELRALNAESVDFVMGLLSGEISSDDLVAFGFRLVTLAEYIRERADTADLMVVEGSVVDEAAIAGRDRSGRAGDG